jgi:hypothetical protein
MKILVVVDAYNLYYAGRKLCGRGVPGWRWLDLRSLASQLLAEQQPGLAASSTTIVYCTARIDAVSNPSGAVDQDVYLKALLASGSVDRIDYGHYVARVKYAPLARPDRKGRPVLVRPDWPIRVKNGQGAPDPDAQFMASVAHWEEKGSDVNVASRLLIGVLDGSADAAVVISNDSDLRLPIQEARLRVPVGLVNPGSSFTAGALQGFPSVGVGGHWWRTLRADDYTSHQLTDPSAGYPRPAGW